MKGCPYRKDFYEKIGVSTDADKLQMKEWVEALEKNISIIQKMFADHPAYIKGM